MIWLIFAHYIGDIALQAPWQAENKGKYWYVMFSHCMIWAACVCITLQYLGIFTLSKAIFLVVGHWVCDKWKTTIPKTPENWKYIYPDQLFHLLQLIFVWII